VSTPSERHDPRDPRDRAILRRGALRDAAQVARARDLLLIVARDAAAPVVVEGLVCGEHWSGRLELDLAAEPLVAQALAGDAVVRGATAGPQRVCGPFWSSGAALVPWHADAGSVVTLLGEVGPDVADAVLRDAATAARALVPAPETAEDATLVALRALDDVLRSPSDSVAESMERLAAGARRALRCDAVVVWVNEGRRAVGHAGSWSTAHVDALTAAVADACADGGEALLAQRLRRAALPEPAMPPWRDLTVVDLPEIGKLVALALPRGAPRPPAPALRSRVATVGALALGTALTRERLSWHADHARSVLHRDALTGLLNGDGWRHALRRLANADADGIHTVLRLEVTPGGDDPSGEGAEADAAAELQEVAAAMIACSRQDDVVARVGPRELCLLVHDAGAAAAAQTAAEVAARVREQLSRSAPQLRHRVWIGWAVAEHARAIAGALDAAAAPQGRGPDGRPG
jgi:GGDEF domain-containing protein